MANAYEIVWQETGWGAIIYLAALSAIDPELHEAAIVDGASRVQRIVHIDIPGILPTVTILLILRFGRVLFVGFEKVLLMQNPLNLPSSEIIQTYVYKIGLVSAIPNYSYAAAIGLFSAVISFVLLVLFPLQIVLRTILIQNQVDATMMEAIEDLEQMAAREHMEALLKYALIVVASVPVLMVYPFVQRYFVKGVMIGALKG